MIGSTPHRRNVLAGGFGFAALAATKAGAISQSPAGGRKVNQSDVIIVGAGLSGLKAALMLEQEGIRVALIEARNRIGGRVFTLDDVPGHPEGGGNGIGSGYARVIDMAARLNVPLIPVRERTESTQDKSLLVLGDQVIRLADWANSPINPFPDSIKAKFPWEVQWLYLGKANPLPDSTAWRDPAYSKFDVSIFEFLIGLGLSESAALLACGAGLVYGTNPYDFSTLAMFHTLAWAKDQMALGKQAFAVNGGNQRLPEAMAKAVKGSIHLGERAGAIVSTEPGVEIRCLSGNLYRAKIALISAPFPALRQIRFDPILNGQQARAVMELGYSNAVQFHFVPTRRFWEQDGLPLNMWTDGLAGRIAALRYGDDPNDVTSFLAYVNGPKAEWLDRLAPADATSMVLNVIERIRPAAKGYLKPVKTLSWQSDPFAGGTFSSWKPGQITAFAEGLAAPAGRIHFCGEHTAEVNRGMEAAMESGERAAVEILNAL